MWVWLAYHWWKLRRNKLKHVWCLLTRKCPMCGTRGALSLRRGNCAYEQKLQNYFWCCINCHETVQEYYQDLWDDFPHLR